MFVSLCLCPCISFCLTCPCGAVSRGEARHIEALHLSPHLRVAEVDHGVGGIIGDAPPLTCVVRHSRLEGGDAGGDILTLIGAVPLQEADEGMIEMKSDATVANTTLSPPPSTHEHEHAISLPPTLY